MLTGENILQTKPAKEKKLQFIIIVIILINNLAWPKQLFAAFF